MGLALAVQASAWVLLTWPHFRPALTFESLSKVLILAALANLCYSEAYLVDVRHNSLPPASYGADGEGALAVGTLFALLIAQYWIADEIYPSVGAA